MMCVYLLPPDFLWGALHCFCRNNEVRPPLPFIFIFIFFGGALHCFCTLATYRRHGNTPSRGTPLKREPQLRR